MTSSLLYIVQSAPWIGAGLLVGFFVGRSTVAAEVIIDAAQGDNMPATRKRVRFTSNGVIAAVLIALGIATAVQAYVQSEATARLTDCQTAYANGFADALDARSNATAEAQDALDQLLTVVAGLDPSPDSQKKFRDALSDYLEKRAKAKKTQVENPYPEPPRDVCKGK